jgi:general secretion pathway protein K
MAGAARRLRSGRCPARRSPSHPGGFALIVVLWFLVLIAAIGTYLMTNARSEAALARNILAATRAEALADAGVAEAVFNLTDPDTGRRWAMDGASHEIAVPGGTVAIRLRDEAEKINPNLATSALIAALFAAIGNETADPVRLGDAIADWVGPGDQPRPAGAKKEQYRAAGLDYEPPNAPVHDLDELSLVLGMTPEALAAARPYLTVYTKVARPDGRNASEIVRRALSLAPEAGAAQAVLQTTAPAAPDPSAPDTVAEIEVTARGADGGVFLRHAVVALSSGSAKGYIVLDWRRGVLGE